MASPTPNKGYTYPAHGGAINAWDTPLNDNFDQIDKNVAGFYPIAISTSITGSSFQSSVGTIGSTTITATPSASIAQNLIYRFTGTMGSSLTFVVPTVGSFYIIDNQMTSTGFTFKVNTGAGSSGTTLPSGINMVYTSTIASNPVQIVGELPAGFLTSTGAPNLSSATAGAAAGSITDVVWDGTNRQLYACVVTGTSATQVWTQTMARVEPQGYLTTSTDPTFPVLSADKLSATTVFYTPFTGGWAPLSNGTTLYPYQFSQMSLALSAGAHAANNAYDVFLYNSTAGVLIGTGPAWNNSGAGTGSRGTGAGTTQLARLQGTLTNAVQITLTNGSTTFVCPVNQGIYLGSLLIDGTAGQITCHRSFGQSRKFGVWNYYNRLPITLKAGTNTSSWTYSSTSVRHVANSSQNELKVFSGAADQQYRTRYLQFQYADENNAFDYQNGIGWNSSAAYSGTLASYKHENNGTNNVGTGLINTAQYLAAPSLGMQQVFALENMVTAGATTDMLLKGTESYMTLSAEWNG